MATMADNVDKMAKETLSTRPSSKDITMTGESSVIYIDPEREAAVRRKFDIYVVPVSVIYLVMSTLDRNNVSILLLQ
jgi:hypothetical protein